MTPIEIGYGLVDWFRDERVSDRYGAFYLTTNDGGPTPLHRLIPFAPNLPGKLFAVVMANRKSGHIGDLFRGFQPTTPEVGEHITLGHGDLFYEVRTEEGVEFVTVGVRPADGRAKDWLDPKALYRCHNQTVALFFQPEGAPPDGPQ